MRNSLVLIDRYMPRDAPLSELLLRFPRFADKAAPAAICCFLDLAGIVLCFETAYSHHMRHEQKAAFEIGIQAGKELGQGLQATGLRSSRS